MSVRNDALLTAAPHVNKLQACVEPCGTGEAVILLASRLGMGGAERHTITLANLLSRRFRVVVAYLKAEEDMIGLLDHAALLELRCLHVRRKIDLRAAGELAELAEKHSASAIVCANAFALMYAHLARFRTRKHLTIVEIFHTTKLRTLKEQLSLMVYRPFFWAAHHLVFVCHAQREYWMRRGLWGQHTHAIYNGVDLQHFAPATCENGIARTRESFGFTADDRVVGICAVLRPEKAHIDLLAAVAILHGKGEEWKVLMIGDGPMRGVIEQEVVRLGLGRSVRITGLQSDVRELLAACDTVALVSTTETFSIAALEAMAMGKPMIMSDVGGAREQVTHGANGLLFPPGDVAALATCLQQCWDRTKAGRMGLVARQRVEREFSQTAMIDRYSALLSEIIGSATRPETAVST